MESGQRPDQSSINLNPTMNRRTFLKRALAVGLTSSAAVSLLEACGAVETQPQPSPIEWGMNTHIHLKPINSVDPETLDTFRQSVDKFVESCKSKKQKRIRVNIREEDIIAGSAGRKYLEIGV